MRTEKFGIVPKPRFVIIIIIAIIINTIYTKTDDDDGIVSAKVWSTFGTCPMVRLSF